MKKMYSGKHFWLCLLLTLSGINQVSWTKVNFRKQEKTL